MKKIYEFVPIVCVTITIATLIAISGSSNSNADHGWGHNLTVHDIRIDENGIPHSKTCLRLADVVLQKLGGNGCRITSFEPGSYQSLGICTCDVDIMGFFYPPS